MESRAIQSRIHFFEYYSLEKFEESLRNALLYSLDIILQQDRLIQFHQYSQEIASIIEFVINIPFAYKTNSSFGESFFGFSLDHQKYKILNLCIRQLYPYIKQKLFNLQNNSQGRKKQILQIVYKVICGLEIALKLYYLLNEKSVKYSFLYILLRGNLIRQENNNDKYNSIILGLFLFMKFLDYYFQKKKVNQGQVNLIEPIKQNKLQLSVCPYCKKLPINSVVLKTNGKIYCNVCIQKIINERHQVGNQVITDQHYIKIYE
ncbi:hypothetical protein pb186bvf_003753 [Paramecium bursaria]